MAAITFDTADQRTGRLETALTALRQMLDAFVSYRMRLAAAEAEQIRPRPARNASSSSISTR